MRHVYGSQLYRITVPRARAVYTSVGAPQEGQPGLIFRSVTTPRPLTTTPEIRRRSCASVLAPVAAPDPTFATPNRR